MATQHSRGQEPERSSGTTGHTDPPGSSDPSGSSDPAGSSGPADRSGTAGGRLDGRSDLAPGRETGPAGPSAGWGPVVGAPLVPADPPCGELAGLRLGPGHVVFRGIPFARPPVGRLRWRAPQRLPRWAGRRPADRPGPAPIQPQPPRDTVMWHTNFSGTPVVISEDCLYLDVHTPDPDPAGAAPVLVWVHGGGNRFGHGTQGIHDPSAWVRAGIVVVTLNYRLGALGWLAHPELAAENDGAAGNYGLMDVLAALEWVQENIAALGGDPRRVTAAGNSAGAVHVGHLIAAPRARGLFARAIGQSSSPIGRADGDLPSPRAAGAAGQRWADRLGATSIAALRARSAVELVTPGTFGPVEDGMLLTGPTTAVYRRGDQAPVPLLAGVNADEGSFYALPGDVDRFLAVAAAHDPADPFHQVYPPGDARTCARRWVGDSRFVRPVWTWASTHARTSGAPVWLYRFEQVPPLPEQGVAEPRDGLPGFGAFHTAELPYVWDSLHRLPWRWRPRDHQVAAEICAAWAAFVLDGDPGTAGRVDWPTLDPARARVMCFGPRPGVRADPDAAVRVGLDTAPENTAPENTAPENTAPENTAPEGQEVS